MSKQGRPRRPIPETAARELERHRWRLLTVQDLARIYQITTRTVYRYRTARIIPRADFQFGAFVRWKFSTINKQIK